MKLLKQPQLRLARHYSHGEGNICIDEGPGSLDGLLVQRFLPIDNVFDRRSAVPLQILGQRLHPNTFHLVLHTGLLQHIFATVVTSYKFREGFRTAISALDVRGQLHPSLLCPAQNWLRNNVGFAVKWGRRKVAVQLRRSF